MSDNLDLKGLLDQLLNEAENNPTIGSPPPPSPPASSVPSGESPPAPASSGDPPLLGALLSNPALLQGARPLAGGFQFGEGQVAAGQEDQPVGHTIQSRAYKLGGDAASSADGSHQLLLYLFLTHMRPPDFCHAVLGSISTHDICSGLKNPCAARAFRLLSWLSFLS